MQTQEPYLALKIDPGIMTDAEWGKQLGISPVTWWRIRNGHTKPSAALVARMSLAFPETSLDDLFEARRD